MFSEPVNAGRARADCSADKDSRRTADQAADQHATGRTAAGFYLVAAVVTGPFELAFLVDVRAASGVGVNQRGIEKESFAGRQDKGLGQNSDGRLARNAARFVH